MSMYFPKCYLDSQILTNFPSFLSKISRTAEVSPLPSFAFPLLIIWILLWPILAPATWDSDGAWDQNMPDLI